MAKSLLSFVQAFEPLITPGRVTRHLSGVRAGLGADIVLLCRLWLQRTNSDTGTGLHLFDSLYRPDGQARGLVIGYCRLLVKLRNCQARPRLCRIASESLALENTSVRDAPGISSETRRPIARAL